jgi:hypothetical protein
VDQWAYALCTHVVACSLIRALPPPPGLTLTHTLHTPCCRQDMGGVESGIAQLTAAVQCRATKALRALLSLPNNCTALVGLGSCMQRLPTLLLSGSSATQQLSSALVCVCISGHAQRCIPR